MEETPQNPLLSEAEREAQTSPYVSQPTVSHPFLSRPVREQDSAPSALELVFGAHGAAGPLMWAHVGRWEEGAAAPGSPEPRAPALQPGAGVTAVVAPRGTQTRAHSAPCRPHCA